MAFRGFIILILSLSLTAVGCDSIGLISSPGRRIVGQWEGRPFVRPTTGEFSAAAGLVVQTLGRRILEPAAYQVGDLVSSVESVPGGKSLWLPTHRGRDLSGGLETENRRKSHEIAATVRYSFEFDEAGGTKLKMTQGSEENTLAGEWSVVQSDEESMLIEITAADQTQRMEIVFEGEDQFSATEIDGDPRTPPLRFTRRGKKKADPQTEQEILAGTEEQTSRK